MIPRKTARGAVAAFASLLTLSAQSGTIDSDLQAALADLGPRDKVDVIVRCADPVDPATIGAAHRGGKRATLVKALRERATLCERFLAKGLATAESEGEKGLWLTNAVAATLRADRIDQLADRPGVARISLNRTIELIREPVAPVSTGQVGAAGFAWWNLSDIRIPDLWAIGYDGAGVVVATLDTGVDINHPALAPNWRGGTNSWFDPSGKHPLPHDADGHGTAVMGLLVGGDSSGVTIGAAPGAQWIAVKIFDDSGVSDIASIHQAYQWILDPDGDPATDDAPDIVNNSWALPQTDRCDGEFAQDIAMLRSADIAVVFSAGNFGPGAATSVEPANNPGSLPVGSVDFYRDVSPFSSRGPSACSGGLYPRLVAPGESVLTAGLTNGGANPQAYVYATGTSFAAPHVAGALAVLKSAEPDATVTELEAALEGGALDLGTLGPDNDSGAGFIDVVEAYSQLDAAVLYLSLAGDGNLAGLGLNGSDLAYADEDILSWNGIRYAMVFDGSAAGLSATADIVAFDIDSESNRILMVFGSNQRVPGVGKVTGADIVAYDLGSGGFSLLFDGSDVGLGDAVKPATEYLDALQILPDGRLIVSVRGFASVPSGRVPEKTIGAADEDLLVFTPAALGADTSGTWARYFDGSDVGLGTGNGADVDAVSIAGNGDIYLSTLGDFTAAGLFGENEDVFVCTPTSLGATTACTLSLFFDGTAHGLGDENVDAISLP
jgi:serine protease AprX